MKHIVGHSFDALSTVSNIRSKALVVASYLWSRMLLTLSYVALAPLARPSACMSACVFAVVGLLTT